MGGASRSLSLSSLCATALAQAKPPIPFLAPTYRILPLRLAAAMSSFSASPAPTVPAASGDTGAPAPSASSAIDFLTLCCRLKRLLVTLPLLTMCQRKRRVAWRKKRWTTCVNCLVEAQEPKKFVNSGCSMRRMPRWKQKLSKILTRAKEGPRRVLPVNSRQISDRCWKSMVCMRFAAQSSGKFQTDVGKAWTAEIASRRK